MAEEVLRLRTIVVPDNNGMRQVQQNVQQLGRTAQGVFQQVKTSSDTVARSFQQMNREAASAGMAVGRAFGALGVSLTIGALAQKLNQVSKEMIDLSYASREMGMSERHVRAFMNAAEKVGVSGDAIAQTLKNVRGQMAGLNYAGSEFRAGLIEQVNGGRALAAQLMAIQDPGERTIELWKTLNALMAAGNQRAAEVIAGLAGIPLDQLRVDMQNVNTEFGKLTAATGAQEEAAKKLRSAQVDLNTTTSEFARNSLPPLVGALTTVVDWFNRASAATDKWRESLKAGEAAAGTETAVPGGQSVLGAGIRGLFGGGGTAPPGTPKFQTGGIVTGTGLAVVHAGERVLPASGFAGMPDLRGAAGEDRLQDEETTEEGTFKALVRFDSYLKMGKNLGGGGGAGGAGGAGTGAGGGTGLGGGYGGSQPGGVGQGSGQQDQSTSKSDATQAPGFGQGIPGFTPGPGGTKVPSFGGTFGSMKDFVQVPTRSVGGASGQGDPSEVMPGDSPARQANVRTNNPGAQYPSDVARRFGMSGQSVIGGGHKIAHFPTPVHGAAANFATLSGKNYIGKTIAQAMRTWSGGSRSIPGPDGKPYDPNTIITADMVRDPNFAIPFMKAVTSGEGRGKYPMSDAQWGQAHNWFMAGSPQGDALKRTENLPGAPEGTRQAYRPQLPGEGGGGGGAVGAPYAGVKSMADLRIGSGNRYGASRSGGGRAHSGNDLHAPGGDGSAVLSMTGGTVLYNGNNAGYGANIVIKGDDGVIRRYATHAGTENLRPGARVEQGQRIGIQGKGHTHYEEIPPTIGGRPNPVYGEFERNARTNTFTSTSHQRGTVDPSGAQGTLAQIGKTPPTSVAGAPSGAIVEGAPPGAGASNAERLMQRRASMLSQNTRRSEMPGGFIKDDTRAEGAIDRANGAQSQLPSSSINLDVRHDGTRASARVAESKGPAFADTKIKNQTQMQPTADYGKTAEP